LVTVLFNGGTLIIYPSLGHFVWTVIAFLFGSCIGSFLNVVIYRVPLGMSVNKPDRSFCPHCKYPIPMRQNIPLFSWLLLRGKCANCGAPIAFRYFAVELLTALLFAAVWVWMRTTLGLHNVLELPMAALIPLWIMTALFVSIAFIDAEHMIIPLALTWSGVVCGLIANALWPKLSDLSSFATEDPLLKDGLSQAGLGWVIGFFGLWAVVLLGKLAFGKKKMEFPEAVAWHIMESEKEEETVFFEIGDHKIFWWDLFNRPSDRLLVECATLRLNGEEVQAGTLTIREDRVEFPDGSTVMIETLQSLDGTAAKAVIPREAMGMGDVHLLGMIGAFFGWTGVFFSLFAASIYAIVAAVLGRIGFGKQLPFGPFLILGAASWMFGAWKLAAWYFLKMRGY
jgi:leader peptidase (prepilin peptidase)/N-methyltransferase